MSWSAKVGLHEYSGMTPQDLGMNIRADTLCLRESDKLCLECASVSVLWVEVWMWLCIVLFMHDRVEPKFSRASRQSQCAETSEEQSRTVFASEAPLMPKL